MAFFNLDKSVQVYCEVGVAPSTKRSYSSAYKQFDSFCSELQIHNSFSVTEFPLCHITAHLAWRGLAPSSIKLYLSTVRHMHILAGHQEPRADFMMARLKLVLIGIARKRKDDVNVTSPKPRLPITASVLQ